MFSASSNKEVFMSRFLSNAPLLEKKDKKKKGKKGKKKK
jgi:hypothetical protein